MVKVRIPLDLAPRKIELPLNIEPAQPIRVQVEPAVEIPMVALRGLQGPPGVDGADGADGDATQADIDASIAEHRTEGDPHPTAGYLRNVDYTFTQANLSVARILVVSHSLNAYPRFIQLFNDLKSPLFPDHIEVVSDSVLWVDLKSFAPISGVWSIIIGV